MLEHTWAKERNKTVICIDSYEDGIPVGRIYGPEAKPEHFSSLTQILIKIENMLDEAKRPQSFAALRTFAVTDRANGGALSPEFQQGELATFSLQVLFRQHASWQGTVTWMEEHLEQSFRSVMELIMLMDSALRHPMEMACE